jgi:hypothetical protein
MSEFSMKTFCWLRCALTSAFFGGNTNGTRTKEKPNYSARTLDSAGYTRCASSFNRSYAVMRLVAFLRRRHRLKPTAPPLRLVRLSPPPLAPADTAPLTRSTQTQQKARSRQVQSNLAFFSLCARVGGPPPDSPPFKAVPLRNIAFGGFPPRWARGGCAGGADAVCRFYLLAPRPLRRVCAPLAGQRARGARILNCGSAYSFCQGSRQAGKPALDNRKA